MCFEMQGMEALVWRVCFLNVFWVSLSDSELLSL